MSAGIPATGTPAAQDAVGGVADGTGVGDEAELPPQPDSTANAAADTTPTPSLVLICTCPCPGVSETSLAWPGGVRGVTGLGRFTEALRRTLWIFCPISTENR